MKRLLIFCFCSLAAWGGTTFRRPTAGFPIPAARRERHLYVSRSGLMLPMGIPCPLLAGAVARRLAEHSAVLPPKPE